MPSALAISSIFGAAAVLVWRLRETTRPVTIKKIVIPPLGMATGLSMFFYPPMRIPFAWGLASFVMGAIVFSYPLIKTTTLERRGDVVWLQRSRAFLAILLGLVVVRLGLRHYVEGLIDARQTASLFFLLAFGMIIRWRVWMYVEYRKLAPAEPLASS
jgi:membrane protein CcdC involved in cytochrome C biogenesis